MPQHLQESQIILVESLEEPRAGVESPEEEEDAEIEFDDAFLPIRFASKPLEF